MQSTFNLTTVPDSDNQSDEPNNEMGTDVVIQHLNQTNKPIDVSQSKPVQKVTKKGAKVIDAAIT